MRLDEMEVMGTKMQIQYPNLNFIPFANEDLDDVMCWKYPEYSNVYQVGLGKMRECDAVEFEYESVFAWMRKEITYLAEHVDWLEKKFRSRYP